MACTKKRTSRRASSPRTTSTAVDAGCDYSDIEAADTEYQAAIRAEEIACNSLSTAEAALLDAQGVHDVAEAALEDAIAVTDAAKEELDIAHAAKRE